MKIIYSVFGLLFLLLGEVHASDISPKDDSYVRAGRQSIHKLGYISALPSHEYIDGEWKTTYSPWIPRKK